MKPPVFDYIAADSIAMAVAALAQAGDDGKIIAGGQSLVPMLAFRLAQRLPPGARLVDQVDQSLQVHRVAEP